MPTPTAMAQPIGAGLNAQLMPALARVGSGSLRVTPVAVPTPSFVTVIVKPTGLPATTVCASGVFVTVRCGVPVTQVPVWSVALPAFVLVIWTWLFRFVAKVSMVVWQAAIVAPPAGAVVGLLTWTLKE